MSVLFLSGNLYFSHYLFSEVFHHYPPAKLTILPTILFVYVVDAMPFCVLLVTILIYSASPTGPRVINSDTSGAREERRMGEATGFKKISSGWFHTLVSMLTPRPFSQGSSGAPVLFIFGSKAFSSVPGTVMELAWRF